MSLTIQFLFVVLFAVAPLVGVEGPEQYAETQLFIIGQTDETGEVYGSVTEEADLRSLLTKFGVAAHIVLEVKPDRVVTTMSLLRKTEEGKVMVANIRFTELMNMSLSWSVAKPSELDRELVRRQVDGFMQMAEAYLAAAKPK